MKKTIHITQTNEKKTFCTTYKKDFNRAFGKIEFGTNVAEN